MSKRYERQEALLQREREIRAQIKAEEYSINHDLRRSLDEQLTQVVAALAITEALWNTRTLA
jgi:hypothetical protein